MTTRFVVAATCLCLHCLVTPLSVVAQVSVEETAAGPVILFRSGGVVVDEIAVHDRHAVRVDRADSIYVVRVSFGPNTRSVIWFDAADGDMTPTFSNVVGYAESLRCAAFITIGKSELRIGDPLADPDEWVSVSIPDLAATANPLDAFSDLRFRDDRVEIDYLTTNFDVATRSVPCPTR